MKLQYTYETWEPMITYPLDSILIPGSLMKCAHIFRTQKEADYFQAYALLRGVSVEVFVKWKMPPRLKEAGLSLWAKLPDLP